MVAHETACIRRMAQGSWPDEMRYWRFLANERVTVEALIEGWSSETPTAAVGRHVLAIQDTSEIKFPTSEGRRRGLGKVKKGNVHGVLLHAMIAVDAESGALLGLAGGKVWTRAGDVTVPHAKRSLEEKESSRWIATAEAGKACLAEAAMITVIDDREGDFYAHWALTPGGNVHLITRLRHDHTLVKGGTVRKAMASLAMATKGVIELRERHNRAARTAHVGLRFDTVVLKRPVNTIEKDLPAGIPVNVIEVIEPHPPKGAEPVHWLLITTHRVATVADAWQIVEWYRRRWIIEQLFRTMKGKGLHIEDSQLETADRLCKMVAIAAKAAVTVLQLVQARDGRDTQSARLAFTEDEINAIAALNTRMQGNTARQKNPHPPHSLAWAAWVIAKLGGWNEYSAKPPGPITFHNGLTYFRAFAAGWAFKHV